MALLLNLRHLADSELHRKGELSAEEMDWGIRDDAIRIESPLQYDLTVQKLEDALLAQGSLQLMLKCSCVRCLKSFSTVMKVPSWTLHLPLQGEDKVTVTNDCVDLTPFLREDILLEFPQHPLCKPECAGLKTKSKSPKGKDAEKAASA